MNQPTLFPESEIAEAKQPVSSDPLRGLPIADCATPDVPGSGPPGERCGTCAFRLRRRNDSGSKQWYKCSRSHPSLYGGRRTDIKMRWPACSDWRPDYFQGLSICLLVPEGYPHPETAEDILVMADYAEEHQTPGWEILAKLRNTNVSPLDFLPF